MLHKTQYEALARRLVSNAGLSRQWEFDADIMQLQTAAHAQYPNPFIIVIISWCGG